jgi:hypothetical protein
MKTTNWAVAVKNEGAEKLRELVDDALYAIENGFRDHEVWFRIINIASSPEISPNDVYSMMEVYIIDGRDAVVGPLKRIRKNA